MVHGNSDWSLLRLSGVLYNLDDDGLLVLTAETLKEILKLCDTFISLNLDDGVLSIWLGLGIDVVGYLSVSICPQGLYLNNLSQ